MLKLKKILSTLLVVCMCVTMLPVLPVTYVSAAGSGDYKTAFEVTVQSVANQKYLTLSGAATPVGGGVTATTLRNNPVKFTADEGAAGTTMTMGYWLITDGGKLNINFRSKETNLTMAEVYDVDQMDGAGVYHRSQATYGGWESFGLVPQGDGTVALTSNRSAGRFLSVNPDTGVVTVNKSLTTPGNNEKFVIHTAATPPAVDETSITFDKILDTSAEITWTGLAADAVFSGYEVWRCKDGESNYENVSGEIAGTTFLDEGLAKSTTYTYKIRTVNGDSPFNDSNASAQLTTLNDPPPKDVVTDIAFEETAGGVKLSWSAVDGATKYDIARADGKYSPFTVIESDVTETSYVDAETLTTASKYSYYRVQPKNDVGDGLWSEAISLENKIFGDNMLFFGPNDDIAKVNSEFARVYNIQKDAQFGTERFAMMLKPGDYSTAAPMQIGFYTHIAGLGRTPYDVAINNISIPAYLPSNNATCNFWRSAENFSVKETNDTNFLWAVSQAAPNRRLYVERMSQFDWNYGNASGGYAADSIFVKGAGSYPQQQYYIRNSELKAGAYGINWNGVFQGTPGAPATNWDNGQNGSQYTNIANTPIIREKPFLYMTEAGEYEVFVPGIRKDAVGVSWSETSMGIGESLSLDEFYIAKSDVDNAASINAALQAGKHIFLTPGIYHAEEAIVIENPNTIVMGLGMATIIPDNSEAGIIVEDVDGVTVAGVIIDAGAYSDHLMLVGRKGSSNDHAANPTLLADVFFRVGGVHPGVASADIALEVNSDDVIGDHFWIWRADHGDGVSWYENTSRYGLLVNGDDMTMYGLFNEHFQEYQTLWNGENGRMYFYQCETPYDPQSQEEWMSHEGTVKGYAGYKVANNVDNHFAIGLGIYNVFINTNGADIFMDNAIEVPNKPGVKVVNACIVELSGAGTAPTAAGAKVGANSIVNGTGDSISAGPGGTGFKRATLLEYVNGVATIRTAESGVPTEGTQPEDMPIDIIPEIEEEIAAYAALNEADYSAASWTKFAAAKVEAEALVQDPSAKVADLKKALAALDKAKDSLINKALGDLIISIEKEVVELKKVKEADYTAASWTKFTTALNALEQLLKADKPVGRVLNAELAKVKTAKAELVAKQVPTPTKPAQITKLVAPKSVKAVQSKATQAKVTWAAVTGASKYEVYRSTKAASGYKKVGTVSATSYTDKKASAGKTFYYKVVAVGKTVAENSPQSASAKVTILKKATVTLKAAAKGKIKVNWKKVTGATGYEVYVSTTKNGKYKKAATIKSGKTTTKTIAKIGKSKLKSGQRYYVKVRAIKKVNNKNVAGVFSTAKRSSKVK